MKFALKDFMGLNARSLEHFMNAFSRNRHNLDVLKEGLCSAETEESCGTLKTNRLF